MYIITEYVFVLKFEYLFIYTSAMSLIKYTEQQKHDNELKGRELYRVNRTLRDVANVMEHPEFRMFVDRYFKDPIIAQSILMFIKVYELAEKNDPHSTPYQKLTVLESAISNNKSRKIIHNEFIKWREGVSDNKKEQLTITNQV